MHCIKLRIEKLIAGHRMDVEHTPLDGLLVLTPKRFGDKRGWFSEVWNEKTAEIAGIHTKFVQDNHSYSASYGTVRGLHYQSPPFAQAKLVRCGAGAVWDVAVDARKNSPTYGNWFGIELSAENGKQLFIPEGFLHGFSTLTPNAELLYNCSNFYDPESDGSVLFSSAVLEIDWKIADIAELSDKDKEAADFATWDSPF